MGLHRVLFQLNYKQGICYSSCANCTHTQTQTRTQVGIEPRIQNGNIMAHFLHFRQCFIWGSSILCWLLLFWYRFWSWHASHNGIIIIIMIENQREGEKTSKKLLFIIPSARRKWTFATHFVGFVFRFVVLHKISHFTFCVSFSWFFSIYFFFDFSLVGIAQLHRNRWKITSQNIASRRRRRLRICIIRVHTIQIGP